MEDQSDIDLRQLAGRLIANWRWIAVSAIISTCIFAGVALVTTPIYRATVVLISAASDQSRMSGGLNLAMGQLGGLASLAGINIGGESGDTEEALAVLNSRQFTETFINENKLMPVLFADEWDEARGRWKSAKQEPTPGKAYRYFNRKIRAVVQDKKTGIVTLRIDWQDRAQAAAWANALVQLLNSEMRARAISKTDMSIEYLEKELNSTTVVTTRDAINRLIEAQIKQRMLANVTTEYAFRVVDKAVVPDADERVKPKRAMMVIAGLALGVFLGMLGALLFSRSPSRPFSALV